MLRVFNSIGDMFLETLSAHAKRPYLLWRDEVGQKISLTYKEVYDLAGAIGAGLPFEFPGNPYPNVEAKIAEDGELLVRGPNIMKGIGKSPRRLPRPSTTRGGSTPGTWAELTRTATSS